MKNSDSSKYLNLTDETSVPKAAVKETVKEILLIARRELKKPTKELIVLDVGCGFGIYTQEIAKHVKKVVGVEPFANAYKKAVKSNLRKNVSFVNALIEDYKSNEKFDLVISLTTLEHMPKAEESFRQVFKYMKKKSLLYITAPNKLWPIEPHYALPFLSWLPLPFANLYLKLTRRGSSYKDSSYSLTYNGMKKLFNHFPYKYYFFVPSADAIYLGCGTQNKVHKFTRIFGIWLIGKMPIFWSISKGFIMIVKKG